MKNIMLLFVLLIGLVHAETVPKEVQDLIKSAFNGTEKSSMTDFKEWGPIVGLDSLVKISKIQPGTPIKKYWILKDSVLKSDTNAPISKLFVAIIGEYQVPLMIDGKIVAFMILKKNKNFDGKWHIAGESSGGKLAKEWQKVIKKWPKSAGYNPAIVEVPGLGSKRFIHIPEKGGNNLTYLPLQHYKDDSFSLSSDSTYSNLTEGKEMYKTLRKGFEESSNEEISK